VAGVVKHGRKFGAAYFALAAIVGVAIGTFVLLVERPAPKPPPPWSLWKPTAPAPADRATEIAEFVGAQYHLESGKRLVRVVVGGPGSSTDPIRALAVAKKANVQSQSDFDIVDASNTMMFILCGSGKNCSIKEGKPTVARAAVLRREALELALYTFEYVKGTDSVVTFFPPKPGDDPTFALYFRKDDLDHQLDHPLARTLPKRRAPLPGKLSTNERKTIDDLTTTRVFRFELQRARSGERVLVLSPVVG
jgi:hypothetical protein